jgi:hypothetical protein
MASHSCVLSFRCDCGIEIISDAYIGTLPPGDGVTLAIVMDAQRSPRHPPWVFSTTVIGGFGNVVA